MGQICYNDLTEGLSALREEELPVLYLSEFTFPDGDREFDFRQTVKRKCYDSLYPFGVLSRHDLTRLTFEPITILYGGNGCGKTTAINVIAEKLQLERDTLYNRSSFFEDYTRLCRYELRGEIPQGSRIITSDDVFDFMLNLRSINSGIDLRREELFEDWVDLKFAKFQLKSLEDYEQLKRVNLARGHTQTQFVRKSLMDNVREQSNGESAFFYFTSKIKDDGLYLLDGTKAELAEYPLNGSGEIDLDMMGTICTESGTGLPVRGDPFVQELDADALSGAVVRTRRAGDFIHPLGASGRQKLQDYFVNRHVDRPLRDSMPLIARGSEVLWVMGEGISERAKLKEGSKAIRVKWTDSPIQKIWRMKQ